MTSTIDNGYRYTRSTPINIPYPTYKDPCFPAIQENIFEILNSKEINLLLTCRIERLYAKADILTTNDRFMLIPDFFSDTLGSEFTSFLDHLEGVSEQCKQLFLEAGYDASTWKNPVQSNNR